MARASIGTSGWNYANWKDDFFAGVARKNWLRYCASRFTGLEVNATFYRSLKPETYARWRDETPQGFRFAVKGHRIVTHTRRLRDAAASVAYQRETLAPLGNRLGVVLWQTPASFEKDLGALDAFLDVLKGWDAVRHVLEFRHKSWFDDETAARLGDARVASAISDAPKWPMWEVVTTDLAYVRLHGHTRTYASAYSPQLLKEWAERAAAWLDEGREVHVYFDNDSEGAAPHDALRLMDRLGIAGADDETERKAS